MEEEQYSPFKDKEPSVEEYDDEAKDQTTKNKDQ